VDIHQLHRQLEWTHGPELAAEFQDLLIQGQITQPKHGIFTRLDDVEVPSQAKEPLEIPA
jgi:hypothetical protein